MYKTKARQALPQQPKTRIAVWGGRICCAPHSCSVVMSLSRKVFHKVYTRIYYSDNNIWRKFSTSTPKIVVNSNKPSRRVSLTDNLQSRWWREPCTLADLFARNGSHPALEKSLVNLRPWNAKTFVSKPVITDTMVEDHFPKRVLEKRVAGKDWKVLIRSYLKLSKHRLSALVVFTAVVGYYMGCGGGGETQRFEAGYLAVLTIGTMLCAASANAWNQLKEIDRDAKMRRTMQRPLPAGLLSKRHAAIFTMITGIVGVCTLLGLGDHGIAATLGGLNILLYAKVYTWLKVIHPINTWVGALVGAIPPMMGWSAAREGNIVESGSLILATYLFLWQIPHFHSLAVMCCKDYSAGGYKMLAQSNPRANAIWSIITCVALLCLGPLTVQANMTSSWFGYESAALGLWMLHSCKDLLKDPGNPQAARPLFKVTILYLPVLLGLMCFHRLERQPSLSSVSDSIQRKQDKPRETTKNLKVSRRRVIHHPATYYCASFPFFPPAMLPPAIVFEEEEEEQLNAS